LKPKTFALNILSAILTPITISTDTNNPIPVGMIKLCIFTPYVGLAALGLLTDTLYYTTYSMRSQFILGRKITILDGKIIPVMKNHTAFLYILFAGVVILLGMAFLRKPAEQPKTEKQDMVNLTNDLPQPTQPVEPNKPVAETTPSVPAKVNYSVVLKTTEGDIKLVLNGKDTPITAGNFAKLAKEGFYNNTIFHRVIKGFMIQGGDPKGDGTGGPGYKFNDEPFTGEYTRGTIAMANAGPNTNGSQFFIMHQDYDLQKNYVIFGKVVEGLEVVDKIATAPTSRSAMGENSKPVTPVKILSVEVTEVQ
jgi:peptidylprolyl isomerase